MGGPTPEHLEVLEEIERDGLPGLGEVLRREGLEAVRYLLWEATGVAPRVRPRPRAEEERCHRGA